MQVEKFTDLMDLLKTYSKSISIPTEEREIAEWNELLSKDYDIYATAVKMIFRNIDLESNQKLIRQLDKYPLATLRQIGDEYYESKNRTSEINKMALGEQVMLLREGYGCHFMTVKKRDDKNNVFYEDVVDAEGKIIYIKIDEEYYKKQKENNKHKEYWDKNDLLAHSKIVSQEEARSS